MADERPIGTHSSRRLGHRRPLRPAVRGPLAGSVGKERLSSPSPSLIFPTAKSSSPSAPGETAADVALAMDFQSRLHARQHPQPSSLCSSMSLFVLDWQWKGGGFGSWSHARAMALAVGIRSGRVVVEAEGVGGYTMAYNYCTRLKGLGGCDVFLALSSCPLPSDWRARLADDRVEWAQTHPPVNETSPLSLQLHLHLLRDRRLIAYTEVVDSVWRYELSHQRPAVQGWEAEQLRRELPEEFDAVRLQPECWWNRQAAVVSHADDEQGGEAAHLPSRPLGETQPI